MRQKSNLKYLIIFSGILLLLFQASSFSISPDEYQRLIEKRNVKLSKPERKLKIKKYFDKRIGKYVDIAEGEILVKFKPTVSSMSINSLNTKHRVKTLSIIKEANIHQLSIPKEKTVEEMIQEYQKDPSVEYAEPNYILHAMTTTPNDPYYSLQWGLPLIQANLGWDITKGNSETAIAIIDSGIDTLHTDLTDKRWNNPGEGTILDEDGIDNDGNGYIDDWMGWDFVGDDNYPLDFNGHGTHVSGIAAAKSNNNYGISGLAWNCKIMALRVLDSNGSGSVADVNLAIYYAANNGAKVINLSLGGPSYSSSQNSAIQYAHSKGCVIIAAAGNDGDSTVNYPAGYDNVISVGSIDRNNNRSSFSNYNSSIDICAPGGDGLPYDSGDIYSTIPSNTYGYKAGTSMAAPFVSGLAALIFSQNPSWTNTQVENQITSTADDLGPPGWDPYYGYGRINAARALDNTGPSISITSPNGGEQWAGGSIKNITWTASDAGFGIPSNGISIYYSTDGGSTFPYTIASGISNSGSCSWTVPSINSDSVRIKITASDLIGNASSAVSSSNFTIDSTPPVAPTVNPVASPTNVTSLTLTGTKSADTSVVLVNDSSSEVSYPTSTSWSYTTTLTVGTNNFKIKARDAAGNESSEITVSVTLQDLSFEDPSTGTSVVFPIGSTTDTPTISASVYNNPESLGKYPAARVLIGNAINFTSNVSTFISPITITMKLPAGAINPMPYYWDTATNSWSNSGITVTSKTSTSITFTTTHLSVFAVFDVTGILSDILIYPNPFKLGTSAGVIFDGLAGDERIRIYTIAGELVTSYQVQGAQSWTWDVKNSAGNQVASGIYLYVVTNNAGQKRIGKIAIK